MEDLKSLNKHELMLAFEESVSSLRRKGAQVGTTMGTPQGETDFADLTLEIERYAHIKTEMMRRMP